MGVTKIRFPESSGIGVKPVSEEGTKRLVRKAITYAIDNDRASVTLVHKGNIMKFTEGAFKQWGYDLARDEFGATPIDGGPWCRFADYSVIATLNLNGDYISDALAAQVGGIGMAPGANLSDSVAMFEATHGTAPKYAGKDMVNPSSLVQGRRGGHRRQDRDLRPGAPHGGRHQVELLGVRRGPDRQDVTCPRTVQAAKPRGCGCHRSPAAW